MMYQKAHVGLQGSHHFCCDFSHKKYIPTDLFMRILQLLILTNEVDEGIGDVEDIIKKNDRFIVDNKYLYKCGLVD